MAKIKRRPVNTNATTAQTDGPRGAGPTVSRARRRWAGLILTMFALATVLVAAGPSMVCRSPLGSMLIATATSDLRGAIQVESWRIGWFTPLSAENVVLTDERGQVVAQIPQLTGDKPLGGLLFSSGNLGTFRIHQPQLNITLRDDGSNVEDLLAEYLKPAEKSGTAREMALEIDAARLAVREPAAQRTWTVQPLNLRLHVPRDATEPLQISVAGAIDAGGKPAAFSLQMASEEVLTSSGKPTSIGTVQIQCEGLPLEIARSLLRRESLRADLGGRLFSDLRCQWGLDANGRPRRLIEGQVAVRELLIAGDWTNGETLRIDAIDLPCQIRWEDDQLNVLKCAMSSDIGQLSYQATIPQADKLLTATGWQDLVMVLGQGTSELTGHVDLDRLAQRLPQTLQLRSDVQLTSGRVRLQVGSRPENQAGIWQGRLEAGRISAQHAGREITWDQPIVVTATARSQSNSMRLDRLQAVSDFVQLEASGGNDQIQWSGRFDLSRLANELAKFVDLQQLRLAGQGSTTGSWRQQAGGPFQVSCQAVLNQFELTAAGLTPWTEENLRFDVAAQGALDGEHRLQALNLAEAALVSGGDQLTATLQTPIAAADPQTAWPFDLQLQGQLTTWLRRLRPVIGNLAGLDAQGAIDGRASARFSTSKMMIERSEMTIQPLHLRADGLYIDEPVAKLRFAGSWSSNQQLAEVREAVLETAAATATMRAGQFSWNERVATQNNVQLQIDGDVSRLHAWFRDPVKAPSFEATGAVRCVGRLGYQNRQTVADLETVVDNLLVTPRNGRQWREPSVKLVAAAAYDPASDRLELSRAEINSEMLQSQAAGRIDAVSGRRWLDIKGQLSYDLAKVQRVVQTYFGPGVQLAGSESRHFEFRGPLTAPLDVPPSQRDATWAREFVAAADVGWQWLELFGFQVARGDLAVAMRDGVARVQPATLKVGTGQVLFAPEIRFNAANSELWLPPGKVLDQIELTPAISNQGLQYIAPVLAGTTQARGKLSLQIDQCRIPLETPATGDMAGQLTIHQAELTPGPLVQVLAALLGRPLNVQIAPETQVPFRMVDGRIYHQGLTLGLGDVAVRTQGWVGVDQTLGLLVEMPLPANLLGAAASAPAMQNRSIRVPIGGTLQRPQIDQAALSQTIAGLVREAAVGAAENALRDGLNRGLDQLFGPTPSGLK